MKRPEFTRDQEYWICEILGHWYLEWTSKMTNGAEHCLGVATEQLKAALCGLEVDKTIEVIMRLNDE